MLNGYGEQIAPNGLAGRSLISTVPCSFYDPSKQFLANSMYLNNRAWSKELKLGLLRKGEKSGG